jgi:hypothetical protein
MWLKYLLSFTFPPAKEQVEFYINDACVLPGSCFLLEKALWQIFLFSQDTGLGTGAKTAPE